jgi:hypothetical protein
VATHTVECRCKSPSASTAGRAGIYQQALPAAHDRPIVFRLPGPPSELVLGRSMRTLHPPKMPQPVEKPSPFRPPRGATQWRSRRHLEQIRFCRGKLANRTRLGLLDPACNFLLVHLPVLPKGQGSRPGCILAGMGAARCDRDHIRKDFFTLIARADDSSQQDASCSEPAHNRSAQIVERGSVENGDLACSQVH